MLFLFSWCGYANGLSFKEINEVNINEVEVLVRSEFLQRLLEKCERGRNQFDDNEKEFFFGIYADSIDNSKILRGERLQLIQVANILQSIYQEKGSGGFAQHFDVPKHCKFDKTDLTQLSVGLFYGKRLRKVSNKLALDQNELPAQLFSKLKLFFNTYELEQFRPISEELFKIIDLGNGMRADVICVFCAPKDNEDESLMKRHAIQFDKTGNWNFSNLRKHVKLHLVKGQVKDANDDKVEEKSQDSFSVEIHDSFLNVSKIMTMPVVYSNESERTDSGKNDQIVSDGNSDTMNTLYHQFCAQNLKLVKATLLHNERKQIMKSKIDGKSFNLNILSIAKDGNCLFGAIAHQLECDRTGSSEHKACAVDLRRKVVEHIKQNIDQYAQVLKYHVNSAGNVESTGPEFISSDLCKDGEWGGSETLLAVTLMFEVNIVIFCEDGPIYFSNQYNPKYNRCIFLAFRTLGRKEKDGSHILEHYESVGEVCEDLLYQSAKDFAEKLNKNVLVCD